MDEVDRLRGGVAEVEKLTRPVEQQARVIQQQAQTIEKLIAALEEARRAGKRQTALFRQGPRPVRTEAAGTQTEQQFRRAASSDDETYDVPLQPVCPHCGSRHLDETHMATQYQIELPAKPMQRRLDVHVGCCGECGQRVQGRHELQTSSALGAASVQLGANAGHPLGAAMALKKTTPLNKSLGIPRNKIAKLFQHLFAIVIHRSTSARSIARTAENCEMVYQGIRASTRGRRACGRMKRGGESAERMHGIMSWSASRRRSARLLAHSRGFAVAAGRAGSSDCGASHAQPQANPIAGSNGIRATDIRMFFARVMVVSPVLDGLVSAWAGINQYAAKRPFLRKSLEFASNWRNGWSRHF